MNILLVGAGKMGGALLRRWRDLSLYTEIQVVDPVGGLDTPDEDFTPDVIVFAVKPQNLDEVIAAYKPFMINGPLVISIVAGKTIATFEKHLGTDAKIVRCMPNLPASIGKGITAAASNKNVIAAGKERVEALLRAVGDVVWVEREELLNPVTALSGSGPAYVFLLIETLAAAAVKLGIDKKTAMRLARQTVIGSAALAEVEKDADVQTLRENVTSKGGTTAAALSVLMAENGMQELFYEALEAATHRAKELAN